MKKSELRQIIKEEIKNVLKEKTSSKEERELNNAWYEFEDAVNAHGYELIQHGNTKKLKQLEKDMNQKQEKYEKLMKKYKNSQTNYWKQGIEQDKIYSKKTEW